MLWDPAHFELQAIRSSEQRGLVLVGAEDLDRNARSVGRFIGDDISLFLQSAHLLGRGVFRVLGPGPLQGLAEGIQRLPAALGQNALQPEV